MGLRDRQGRPFMVGQIEHFHGPAHDPDKHLLAIYYMLEQLVAANLRWPGVASFCYILDFGEPAGAREIGGFAKPVPVAVRDPPHRGVRAGMHTLRRGLAVVQTGASPAAHPPRGFPSVRVHSKCTHTENAAVR